MFEYKIYCHQDSTSVVPTEEKLQEFGDERWELVDVVENYYIFKRRTNKALATVEKPWWKMW